MWVLLNLNASHESLYGEFGFIFSLSIIPNKTCQIIMNSYPAAFFLFCLLAPDGGSIKVVFDQFACYCLLSSSDQIWKYNHKRILKVDLPIILTPHYSKMAGRSDW